MALGSAYCPNPVIKNAVMQLDIWDHARSEPVSSFSWGADTLVAVRFNPAEPDILASCASDRSLALYDLRHSTPIRKIVMQVGLTYGLKLNAGILLSS